MRRRSGISWVLEGAAAAVVTISEGTDENRSQIEDVRTSDGMFEVAEVEEASRLAVREANKLPGANDRRRPIERREATVRMDILVDLRVSSAQEINKDLPPIGENPAHHGSFRYGWRPRGFAECRPDAIGLVQSYNLMLKRLETPLTSGRVLELIMAGEQHVVIRESRILVLFLIS